MSHITKEDREAVEQILERNGDRFGSAENLGKALHLLRAISALRQEGLQVTVSAPGSEPPMDAESEAWLINQIGEFPVQAG